MTTCPTCGKPVDPLRSRFAGVLDGKVVAYCSAECAVLAQRAHLPAAAPVASPSPSMQRVASTGVPVRIPTPPAGVAAVARAPAADISSGPPRPITPAPGVPIVVDSGPVIEIVYESSGIVTSARDDRPEPRAHPGERPSAPSEAAGEDSGAVRSASVVDSAPVELPSTGRDDTIDKLATGRAAARRRSARALSEEEAGGDAAPPRKRRTWLVVLLLVLAVAGGLLAYQYLVKHDVAATTKVLPAPAPPAPQAPQIAVVEPRRPPAVEVAPDVDVAAAVEQARATLQTGLTAASQRLARIAAAALARTQDPAACDALAAQLGLGDPPERAPRPGAPGAGGPVEPDGLAGPDRSRAPQPAPQPETSDIAKLDLAYSLARGGDKRGSAALAAALRSRRADVRDEAARLLALLGDRRGVPHLIDLLAVPQRRLGAAAHLAHLAEPRAIKVLEKIRGDAKASAGDKARATIALGIAGRSDVAAALRDMLGDSHESAFAAAALADLEDAAARSVLEHQLESPMLRVRAARALRRLDPALDPRPVLPRLLDVLKAGRDVDQLQAAEAILLLAGPASWSSYE